ncbi:T9SS type A sorting domain-containing protein [Thalassobellus sediminis]|uniref:T9SS type A sorting domain-containing protein n=1 Tax=Thalassobellus sediminis TaxID=3367753 RepID=UPI0037B635DD
MNDIKIIKVKLTLFSLVFSFNQICFSQWINLNSEINDELTGVVFFGDTGIASGKKGIYYTLNGGEGSSSWQRYEISNNIQNSNLYDNTEFNSCYSNPENSSSVFKIYAVGQNKTSQKPILMSIEFPSLEYEIIEINIENTGLADIKYSRNSQDYYAVGNNGLILNFKDNISNYSIVQTFENYGNLSSINFNTTGYQAYIGGYNHYLKMQTSGNSFDKIETPNHIHKDVEYLNSSNVYSINDAYSKFNYHIKTGYDNYFHGPINGNEIFRYSNRFFIGTDHGIFISNSGFNILEWQPSSNKHFINEFWNSQQDNVLYACGKDGVILKNESPIGEAEPYVMIGFDGDCFYSNTFSTHRISIIKGSNTNCKWYIDNELISSSCDNYLNYRFDSPGTYEIRVEVEYNGIISEETKTIHIVNQPEIDKAISITDSVLCKIEATEIVIENSEPNVEYILKNKDSNEVLGISDVGNGGTVSLQTEPIDVTGEFYLSAQSTLANCSMDFTDSFIITVEETKAEFTHSLINAKQNEAVEFYQHSTDAQNFNWDFYQNASTPNSTEENPKISFSTLGQKNVDLEVWSNAGCYDKITNQNGPYIYEDLGHTEDSWAVINGGEDSNPIVRSSMTRSKDGLLVVGVINNNTILGSTQGVEFVDLPIETTGFYLAKYDFNGVLRWVVYNYDNETSYGADSIEDKDGNIYLTLPRNRNSYLVDTTGGKIELDYEYSTHSIIKLDSTGKFLWELTAAQYKPHSLHLDKKNNLTVIGTINPSINNQIYVNNMATDVLGETLTESNHRIILTKFSPNGNLIWENGGYDVNFWDIGFDSDNNIYAMISPSSNGSIYSANNTSPTYLNCFNSRNCSFLAKYTEDGQLLWTTKNSIYSNENTWGAVYSFSIFTDENGNTYIPGSNNIRGTATSSDYIQTFENTDGSLTQNNVGSFYIAKVDSNGICEWINGSTGTYYGQAHRVIKRGREIFVLGNISANGDNSIESSFSGTDGNEINLNINNIDFFIAVYDTEGKLKRIIQNGNNSSETAGSLTLQHFNAGIGGFFNGQGNNFYLSLNIGNVQSENLNNNGMYNNFGVDIANIDAVDGVITRFTENDGIIHYAENLSVNETSNVSILKIHPNPVQNILTINSPSEINQVEIFNMIGQKVYDTFNKNSINVSNLKTGIYIIEIKDKLGNLKTLKFIKK